MTAISSTPVTELFKIEHPIICACMDHTSGPELAAAVTNAGGLGCLAGSSYTPEQLRTVIRQLKSKLMNPNAPFGVDLPFVQIGGNARKTNYDYNKGRTAEYVDLIIEEEPTLFVFAAGVPPQWIVDRLHKARIFVMNIVGHPKYVAKALQSGVDLICSQGGEGGGHTGDIPATVLIPACVDVVRGHKSPLTGGPVYVIGAGAVYDGRSLAANLSWGAEAVWVGTRFVASVEAGAPKAHKEAVLSAGYEDAITTLIYTGRPLRVRRTPYVEDWNSNRQQEIKELTSKGILPHDHELEKHPEKSLEGRTFLIGRVSALIDEVLPAKTIVENMVNDAARIIQSNAAKTKVQAKL
ncbi:uncharacterized protein PHACADRAFT_178346 [Phanerochaete carnosa HHB-10118-sp]|uniref:Uncharacterized protein n=1 Tax=Phanerochaete carnosa (strain HHB-10118-sp) TaxID=650164 RepID=K5WK18_PHACS|nr:uncharacterized protein PHACADRAFT_178346 [Phanerochaete carnosa HHB-10118-sp]EKM50607.1 hypothetical protein PHACADRAFT_178346 [Phanerochaete carnosa HHB-10118-sp]